MPEYTDITNPPHKIKEPRSVGHVERPAYRLCGSCGCVVYNTDEAQALHDEHHARLSI